MTHYEKVETFLKNHGMHPERVPLAELTEAIAQEMERGLAGERCSLDMIPTYLSSGTVQPGRTAAVIDAGGTNFRASRVLFTPDGATLERVERAPMPGVAAPATWDEFIDFTARKLIEVMEDAEGVGFCFSYRAEITPERDGRVILMSKGVNLTGYENHLLCADLKAALRRLGAPEIPAVLVNDTAAVALSGASLLRTGGYDSLIGLVVGTGQNSCCEIDTARIPKLGTAPGGKMLVNLESGCFDGCPAGDFDRELDAATNNPGDHLFEKMTSGAYLGELCRLTLRAAAREGLFSDEGAEKLLAMSELASSTADMYALGETAGFSKADGNYVQSICHAVFERAARCVCANISAILLFTDTGSDAARPACVCADGSVVRYSKAFSSSLRRYLDSFTRAILGRHCVLHSTEEATTLGAAAAALLNG